MVIGIESVYGDKRLVGKTMSLDELKDAVKEILRSNGYNRRFSFLLYNQSSSTP